MGQEATKLTSSRRLAKVFTHDGYVTKQQEGKLKYSISFKASASVIHINVPLAKANHTAKSRFKEWKNRLNLFMGIAANIITFFFLPSPSNHPLSTLWSQLFFPHAKHLQPWKTLKNLFFNYAIGLRPISNDLHHL